MSRIDLHPSVCNLCGGKVLYVSNRVIYGREYGSGKCYYCTECGAYVGTHIPRPEEAFGILADERMREMKQRCHALFDEKWKNEPTSKRRHLARVNAYAMLAEMLAIPLEECHFGYFDLDMLHKAYEILHSL